MILRTRHGGNVELRSSWPDTSLPPSRYAATASSAGVPVTIDTSTGLPALGRAIRLVAGMCATLCLDVYQGEYADKVEVEDVYPAELLESPVEGMSAYDWRYDVFAALEATENALLLKRKDRNGQVVELVPVPMQFVQIRSDSTFGKVFNVIDPSGKVTVLTPNEALHVRGDTVWGGVAGVSRIYQHRDPIGASIATQNFEGSFFRNNARPDLAVIFPQGVTKEQAQQWRDEWESRYQGSGNSGKVVPLGGGASIQPIPVSMQDAQFIQSRQYGVEEIGRVMDVHPYMLGVPPARGGELQEALHHFLAVQLPPRLRRVEQALLADRDLFPAGSDMYPQFELPDLAFADATTKAQVQHLQIQDGTLLVDEARADLGRPPLPDGLGMIPQIVPVGGSPFGVPDPNASPSDI